MSKIRIRLIKSPIRASKRQVATIKALGLGKMDSTVEHENTPQILGMVSKINHLVCVEE